MYFQPEDLIANLYIYTNTIVQRKSSSAHRMMAEATTKGSEKLVNALININNTNKEKENRKIDLQKEIHATNLEYKKERERQLQKTQ